MRVYHFLNEKYGLTDIKEHFLKISLITDLNDPFELLGFDISDYTERKNILNIKNNISKKYGLVCFSKSWSNPLLWSHYADRHKGICLGFDVPDRFLFEIIYSSKKRSENSKEVEQESNININDVKYLLSIKYNQWRYEKEVRWLIPLENSFLNGFYYKRFSKDLILKQIIVGSRSVVSRGKILNLIKDYKGEIETFKARPAFKSFRIVRNKNKFKWM